MEKIVIYQGVNVDRAVEVRFTESTVWLTQRQMADLFETSVDNVGLHLKNIYSDGELLATEAEQDRPVQRTEGGRDVSRRIKHYNLDAIISVGYRVNSKQGVAFRRWATKTLNDHLVLGYTLNQDRLEQRGRLGLEEAQKSVELLASALRGTEGLSPEVRQAVELVDAYAKTWSILLQYDEDRLAIPTGTQPRAELTYEAARKDIEVLRERLATVGEAGGLFGQERGDAFEGILGNIEQTMFGESLYKSAEEKAANLLYFVIKDHPFSDGNKRIGSYMFLRYLDLQGITHDFGPGALPALALLIAESDPAKKDTMVRLTMTSIGNGAAPKNDEVDENSAGDPRRLRAPKP